LAGRKNDNISNNTSNESETEADVWNGLGAGGRGRGVDRKIEPQNSMQSEIKNDEEMLQDGHGPDENGKNQDTADSGKGNLNNFDSRDSVSAEDAFAAFDGELVHEKSARS